jgi:hypothetical protein
VVLQIAYVVLSWFQLYVSRIVAILGNNDEEGVLFSYHFIDTGMGYSYTHG